ncbi:FkbM family methyltransferase [Brevundimonas nasdae]|uniref:FkbM family methyltransferase n=1 Tax=Brevundimonas nasdae TaxID=172043 RepID=UPI00301661E0
MTKPEIKLLHEAAESFILVSSIKTFRDVAAGQTLDVDVVLTNNSDDAITWDDNGSLNLSSRWLDASAVEVIVQDGPRTSVGGFFHPGESRNYKMRVVVPNIVGDATLRLSCVFEGHFWFFDTLDTGWTDVDVCVSPPSSWPDWLSQSPAARAFRGSIVAMGLGRHLDAVAATPDPLTATVPSTGNASVPIQELKVVSPDCTASETVAGGRPNLLSLKTAFNAPISPSVEAFEEVALAPARASSDRPSSYWAMLGRRMLALFQPRRTFERVHDESLQRSRLAREIADMHQAIRRLAEGQADAQRVFSHDRNLLFSSVEAIAGHLATYADDSRLRVEALSRKLDVIGQDTARAIALGGQLADRLESRSDKLQAAVSHTSGEVGTLSREVALIYQDARVNAAVTDLVLQTQRRALRVSRITAQIIAGSVKEAEAYRSLPTSMDRLGFGLAELNSIQELNKEKLATVHDSINLLSGQMDEICRSLVDIETGAHARETRAEVKKVSDAYSSTGLQVAALAHQLDQIKNKLSDLNYKADRIEGADPTAGLREEIVDLGREQATLRNLLNDLIHTIREVPGSLASLQRMIDGISITTSAALEEGLESSSRAAFEQEVVLTLRKLLPLVSGLEASVFPMLQHVKDTGSEIQSERRKIDSVLASTQAISDSTVEIRRSVAEGLNALLVRQIFPLPTLGIVICRSVVGFLAVPEADLEAISYYSDGSIPEPGTISIVEALLSEGDCFVDIGANVGLFSVVAGRRVGARGRVIAFEPTPSTAAAFRATMHFNGVSDLVVLHQAAASDREGSALLNIGRTSGHNSLVSLDGATEKVTVDTIKPDDLLAGLKVHVIKIDVEGWELSVLDGLKATVAENPDVRIILEFGPLHLERGSITIAAWMARIAETGFMAFEINEVTSTITPLRTNGLESVYSMNILLTREVPTGLKMVPA